LAIRVARRSAVACVNLLATLPPLRSCIFAVPFCRQALPYSRHVIGD
jgi:hypothetical protein